KNNDKSCQDAARKIEDAVYGIVKDGIKTKDIGGNKSTKEFTQNVISRIT
ncbi:MAG: isocitrate/isopropylmalate family dehydrogenase, partial [Nitrosotalea sp.]